jgi:hypothetical protein
MVPEVEILLTQKTSTGQSVKFESKPQIQNGGFLSQWAAGLSSTIITHLVRHATFWNRFWTTMALNTL